MGKFVVIGERLSATAPSVNKAFTERDPEPIIKRAKQQLDAGSTYLDVNIGPAENDGPELMKWAVQLLQSEFDNVRTVTEHLDEIIQKLKDTADESHAGMEHVDESSKSVADTIDEMQGVFDEFQKSALFRNPNYHPIGKEGQNARLAARLTGYKIDIKSESQAATEGEE